MTERPILFSGPMVRAILAGSKTMTRLVVNLREFQKSSTPGYDFCFRGRAGCWQDVTVQYMLNPPRSNYPFKCPLGKPGDRLWVREAWWQIPEPSMQQLRDGADTWPKVAYNADESEICREQNLAMGWRLRPSIYMPRWASRITLEITGVRVERLQDISGDDVLGEGITYPGRSGLLSIAPIAKASDDAFLRNEFRIKWDSINGKRPNCSWSDNPWVWVVSFRRIEAK